MTVQANLANIRELKMGMERMEMASNIANFSVALTKAFELLQEVRIKHNLLLTLFEAKIDWLSKAVYFKDIFFYIIKIL